VADGQRQIPDQLFGVPSDGTGGESPSAGKRRKSKESTLEDIMKLCDVVRETGFAIHRYHKHGHLEKVYENALAHRLGKLGLDVKQQYPLKVYDEDGTLIERRNLFPLSTASLTCPQAEKN
jgi:hypothetical protein